MNTPPVTPPLPLLIGGIWDHQKLSEFVKTGLGNLVVLDVPLREKERTEPWIEVARNCRKNKLYFYFIYTQQRNIPPDSETWLTPDIVSALKKEAGKYFLGDSLGELSALVSWFETYSPESDSWAQRYKIGKVQNLEEAEKTYVERLRKAIQLDRTAAVPLVWNVDESTLTRLHFRAGIDIATTELFTGNAEVNISELRGSAKAYDRSWGVWCAVGWYGGYKNEDPLKLKRYKVSNWISYLSGAKIIMIESGHEDLKSFGYQFDHQHPIVQGYRRTLAELNRFTRIHQRPQSGPRVKVAFLRGRLDGWTGWGFCSSQWGQWNNPEYAYGEPELGWEKLLQIPHSAVRWTNKENYGPDDESGHPPYGQYDIIPAETPQALLNSYSAIMVLGWNSMTSEFCEKLRQYVSQGGHLFISVPHLNKSICRSEDLMLIESHHYEDFLGCRVKGKGLTNNWGYKFLQESDLASYRFPVTKIPLDSKEFDTDPIAARGNVTLAEIELTTGKILASTSNSVYKKNQHPVLIENKYGRGYSFLLSTWNWPGHPALSALTEIILRTILAGEQGETKLLGSDKLCYGVFEKVKKSKKDITKVYIANSDFHVQQIGLLKHGNLSLPLTIDSCGIRMAAIQEDFIISPRHPDVDIRQIKTSKQSIEIFLEGEIKTDLDFVLPLLPPQIKNGKGEKLKIHRKGSAQFLTIDLKKSKKIICNLKQ